MKLKIKKFVYLLNDATNILLKKDKNDNRVLIDKMRIILILVSIFLTISIAINIYLYLY